MVADLLTALDEPLPEPARRYGFLVTGPNASGKTTTVQAALEPWRGDRRLAVAYADNADRSTFKGDGATMLAALRDLWLSNATVVVVEGTNRVAGKLAEVIAEDTPARSCEALVTEMTGDTMRRALVARCAKLGKRFRDDYWADRVLEYEGRRRYQSLIERYYPDARVWLVQDGYAACADLGAYLRERVATCLAETV